MYNPPHPGGVVRRQCLEPLGLSVTRAAQGLGVTRQALIRSGQRKSGRLGRNGHPALESVRVEPGDLAGDADRPMTSGRPSRRAEQLTVERFDSGLGRMRDNEKPFYPYIPLPGSAAILAVLRAGSPALLSFPGADRHGAGERGGGTE